MRPKLQQPLVIVPPIDLSREFKRGAHSKTMRSSNHAGWGFGGFLLGVAFWHLVGFWSYMAQTMPIGVPVPAVEVARAVPAEVVAPANVAAAPTASLAVVSERRGPRPNHQGEATVRAGKSASLERKPADRRPERRASATSQVTQTVADAGAAGHPLDRLASCSELLIDREAKSTRAQACQLRPGIGPDGFESFQTAQNFEMVAFRK
ncbi:MAG: hypothetical protein GC150_07795 [Rhizobiales bacterium]|nr:hypothetical protein [Hyphomicrobiales bacterium]